MEVAGVAGAADTGVWVVGSAGLAEELEASAAAGADRVAAIQVADQVAAIRGAADRAVVARVVKCRRAISLFNGEARLP